MAWTKITRAHYERKACRYSTGLTDEEFAVLEPYLPAASPLGRPRKTDLREVVNAILYVLRTGCPWNLLAKGFPPAGAVYGYFRRWQMDGIWADGGCRGAKFETAFDKIAAWKPNIVKRSDDHTGFQVLPRRWAVERTFTWIGRNRRMAKDFERLIETATAYSLIAMIQLMTRRLARQ